MSGRPDRNRVTGPPSYTLYLLSVVPVAWWLAGFVTAWRLTGSALHPVSSWPGFATVFGYLPLAFFPGFLVAGFLAYAWATSARSLIHRQRWLVAGVLGAQGLVTGGAYLWLSDTPGLWWVAVIWGLWVGAVGAWDWTRHRAFVEQVRAQARD